MFNLNLEKEKAKIAAKLLPELLETNKTRQELASTLGVSDSAVRGFVSDYAKKEPVIGHHLRTGYKKPVCAEDDGEDMLLTFKDLINKGSSCLQRAKPIEKWLRKNGYARQARAIKKGRL